MYENINEQVSVAVIFSKGSHKVRPFKVRWNNRDFEITAVDYQYKYKEGQSLIHVFSVTDGISYFELQYDSANLKWILGRISDGEAH
ncbi:hypothetical protein H7Y63_01110 [Polaromonas sp.]|nr:hypothetical protein [Candidatus Saccharibacteria bacterium]